MAAKKTMTTPASEQNAPEKSELELASSRYSKEEQQRMSDGMVP